MSNIIRVNTELMKAVGDVPYYKLQGQFKDYTDDCVYLFEKIIDKPKLDKEILDELFKAFLYNIEVWLFEFIPFEKESYNFDYQNKMKTKLELVDEQGYPKGKMIKYWVTYSNETGGINYGNKYWEE